MKPEAIIAGIALVVALVSGLLTFALLVRLIRRARAGAPPTFARLAADQSLALGSTQYGFGAASGRYLAKGFAKIAGLDTTTARVLIPFEDAGTKYVIVPQKSTVVPSDPQPTSLDAGDSTNATTDVWKLTKSGFRIHQQLSTPGAHGGVLQSFRGTQYLCIPSVRTGTYPVYDEHVNSSMWTWDAKTKKFVLLQQFALKAAKFSSMYVYGGELFAFYACGSALTTSGEYDVSDASPVYRLNNNTGQFEKVQDIQTYGAFDLEMFEVGGGAYLGVVDATTGVVVYKWDAASDQFVAHQTLSTAIQGREIRKFSTCGDDYLISTNLQTGITLFKLDGTSNTWKKTQFLESASGGAHGITVFQKGGDTWVFVSNYIDGDSSQAAPVVRTSSTVYKWSGSGLSWVTEYPSSASSSTSVWLNGSATVEAGVANEATAGFEYTTESAIYTLDLSQLQ